VNLLRHSTAGRLWAGLLTGLLLGFAGVEWLESSARQDGDRAAALRSGQAELMALAEVIVRAGGGSEAAQRAIDSWIATPTRLSRLRLIHLGDRRLLATTVSEDLAAGAVPRQLVREEKPIYDQAQKLRAAGEENREAGRAVKEVVDLERLADGRARATVPLSVRGEFLGVLQAELAGPAPLAGGSGVPTRFARLLWVLGAVGLFALARWALRGRDRGGLLAVLVLAAVVLGAIGGAGHFAWRQRIAESVRAEENLARHLTALRPRVEAALAAAGIADAAPIREAAWDVDRFGAELGLLGADGKIDPVRQAQAAGQAEEAGRVRVGLLAALALAVALFLGLGVAARLWETLRRFRVAYAYATPALLGMLLLVFFPFFYGIGLAFTNANIYNSDQPLREIWIGLGNFKDILGDFRLFRDADGGHGFNYQNFYYTMGFTILWTVANVTIGVTVGLVLALILNTKKLAFKPLYRVLLILPWAVPNYITALIWRGMFHQQFGVINQMLQIAGLPAVSWFEKPVSSFFTVLATNGWLSFPFMMVICLGALQSIPADLYEAARVDGATRWQQFRSITLPSLKPALVPAVILSVIWTFNMFNIIYLVSQGEPARSTEILITQAYKLAFEQYRYGYAAAYSTVIFIILLAYGTWQNRVTKATEGA
jgi:arabinogalactan oligomer/maltooligosaccharide transport system permease protein